jgi:hypothetical protein
LWPSFSREGFIGAAGADGPPEEYWVTYWVSDTRRALEVVLETLSRMGVPPDTAIRVRSGGSIVRRRLVDE